VAGWSWEEKKEVDLRIGAALARRMRDDPGAFDRDREPREGDLAVYRGRVVEVLSLGLPGHEVRRMFRDGELCPFVRLEDTDPPDGARRLLPK
jgi:hypothetical protein